MARVDEAFESVKILMSNIQNNSIFPIAEDLVYMVPNDYFISMEFTKGENLSCSDLNISSLATAYVIPNSITG